MLVALWAAVPSAERSHESASVIIQCPSSCEATIAAVRAAGGQVTLQFDNIEAIAASIPTDRVAVLAGAGGALFRDHLAPVPGASETIGPAGEARAAVTTLADYEVNSVGDEDIARLNGFATNAYNLNNVLTGAATVHAANNRGQGVIVAVIDSGTANAPTVPVLAGSVVGGESLVVGDTVASATSRLNDPHGTRVGSLLAAHGNLVIPNFNPLVPALRAHAPQSVIPCLTPPPGVSCTATQSIVPMVGTAPDAKIYAIKVADSKGNDVPESRLIAAMDRVLTLRRNFNNGVPSVPVAGDGTENNPFVYDSLKIEVVNMSIGGPTLFAGGSTGERLTLEMLDAGIVVIATAGNNGPAAMTLGNPGSGRGALAVGAMSSFVHERILRDVQFGSGSGLLLRPFAANQTASFSSRGPTADGRLSPDVVANGMGSFAQAANGSLALVSGTSFAAPSVSGAAALLRRHAPWASALQIRNALVESANAAAIGDGSTPVDRGRGLLDVAAAVALLDSAAASETLAEGLREDRVATNIKSVGLSPIVFVGNTFSRRVENLQPGQIAHFFVPTSEDTTQIRIRITNIVTEDPAVENQLFGDDLLVHVVDAPTSLARTHVEAFVDEDAAFVVNRPQPGLMRVALGGAFSNGGRVSATITIERQLVDESGKATLNEKVRRGQHIPLSLNIPAGTRKLTVELSWKSHWGRYPTADLDVILVNPLGETKSIATLDSPERLSIDTPVPGLWTVSVLGFALPALDDDDESFDLRVFADGRLLRPQR